MKAGAGAGAVAAGAVAAGAIDDDLLVFPAKEIVSVMIDLCTPCLLFFVCLF